MQKKLLAAYLPIVSGLLLFAASAARAKDLPQAFPSSGAVQRIDNERVAVWEIVVPKGQPLPMDQLHAYDAVGIDLVDATVKVTDGKSSQTHKVRMGEVFFSNKNTVRADQPATFTEESDAAALRRMVFIDLKDVPVPPIKNTSGFPNAFPRDGARKLLENDRVVVWDYTWKAGKPTPMHFHVFDTVTVSLENGEVKSIMRDGQTTVNTNSFGLARFNPRSRLHTEELIKGAARSIIVELKR